VSAPPDRAARGALGRRYDRRGFLRAAGALGAAAALRLPIVPSAVAGPDALVRGLRDSLTDSQRQRLLLPWDDPRRVRAHNNWHVVPHAIRDAYDDGQRRVIEDIVRANMSEDGYERLMRSMRDDAGGLGSYSVALFEGEGDSLTFVLTGRHVTMRANDAGIPSLFDGPVFYGHAVEFNERPDHPGNVWWDQARAASKVFHALDPQHQAAAMAPTGSPRDEQASVTLQGAGGRFAGLPISALTPDQRELFQSVLADMLGPYRAANAEGVRASIEAHGGLDALHIAFYADGDLPDADDVWDRWRIEGPGLSCYFRGSPHVHAWLNVAAVG
jgi:hypothetical protein